MVEAERVKGEDRREAGGAPEGTHDCAPRGRGQAPALARGKRTLSSQTEQDRVQAWRAGLVHLPEHPEGYERRQNAGHRF